MRETHFIQQNREKWKTFEETFETERDPEKISHLFIEITDDLSYSRTYYPNRSVRLYLNNLAQKVFYSIYSNRVRRRKKFLHFWKEELPSYFYAARRQVLFSFLLFLLAFGIGVLSSVHDPHFARFILGDSYIDMTEKNIQNGDPMAVYKEMNGMDMFLGITLNNLRVSFFTLIFGILFGAGTAYFIVYNGIMLGAFQYFFIERGLFRESFLTIWVHGALEISAIIIAGAAGFTLGMGLLFPGTYKRAQSFRMHAMRALQLWLGIAPVIVIAAINESFLTRYTETPDIVRAILIITEFGFMLFYFVIYPAMKARSGFRTTPKYDEIPPDRPLEIAFNTIKSGGEIFAESFAMLRNYAVPILRTVLIAAACYAGLFYLFIGNISSPRPLSDNFFAALSPALQYIFHLFNYTGNTGLRLYALNTAFLALALPLSYYLLRLVSQDNGSFRARGFMRFVLKQGWFVLLSAALLHGILFLHSWIFFICFLLAVPLLNFFVAGQINGGNAAVSFRYYFRNFLKIIYLYGALLLLSYMLIMLMQSILIYINIELIKWNIPFNQTVYTAIDNAFSMWILMSVVFLQICMVNINMGLTYFSLREIYSASGLRSRIARLGILKNQHPG